MYSVRVRVWCLLWIISIRRKERKKAATVLTKLIKIIFFYCSLGEGRLFRKSSVVVVHFSPSRVCEAEYIYVSDARIKSLFFYGNNPHKGVSMVKEIISFLHLLCYYRFNSVSKRPRRSFFSSFRFLLFGLMIYWTCRCVCASVGWNPLLILIIIHHTFYFNTFIALKEIFVLQVWLIPFACFSILWCFENHTVRLRARCWLINIWHFCSL